jgi:hypothetical protein
MPRIRTIKPEFWADEKLSPMSDTTRLVFLGLISMADDRGRLVDSEKQIDAFIFPYSSSTCRRSLADLSSNGRIVRGVTASGQKIIQVANWHHQKIDKPNVHGALPAIADASSIDRRQVGDTVDDGSVSVSVSVPGSVSVPRSNGGVAGATAAPRARKVAPEPPSWAVALASHWVSRAGDTTPKAVFRALHAVVDKHGAEKILRAMDAWLDARNGQGRDPKIVWFAEVASAWITRAVAIDAEPLLDNGWYSPELERETRPGGVMG